MTKVGDCLEETVTPSSEYNDQIKAAVILRLVINGNETRTFNTVCCCDNCYTATTLSIGYCRRGNTTSKTDVTQWEVCVSRDGGTPAN